MACCHRATPATVTTVLLEGKNMGGTHLRTGVQSTFLHLNNQPKGYVYIPAFLTPSENFPQCPRQPQARLTCICSQLPTPLPACHQFPCCPWWFYLPGNCFYATWPAPLTVGRHSVPQHLLTTVRPSPGALLHTTPVHRCSPWRCSFGVVPIFTII